MKQSLTEADRGRTIFRSLPGFASARFTAVMLPRRWLTTFVFALPVLAISFGAFLGTAELMAALGDLGGARAMRWVAVLGLVLLLIDALCLLIFLGLAALGQEEDHE